MLKRISIWILFLLVAAGTALHVTSKRPAPPVPVAFIDRDMLPNEIKNSSDFQDRLSDAASFLASKNHYGLVLDKKIVSAGAIDATAAAGAYLEGESHPRHSTESFSSAPVGTIDHNALLSLPAFRQAKGDYSKLQPLFLRLEKTIRTVAREKGLVCVFDARDVLYGGTDITQAVFNAVAAGGLEKGVLKVMGHTPSEYVPAKNLPPTDLTIAIVDPSQLVPVHPLALRAKELDREIESWRSGRYGIALSILSKKERDEWENARLKAQKDWENRLTALKEEENKYPASSNLTPKKLAEIQSALNQSYKKALSAKMASLEKGFNAQVKDAESASEKALRSYADDLLKFRNQKLSSRQSELLGKLTRDTKNEETRLEETYLQFEKGLLDADQQKKLELQLKLQVAAAAEKSNLEGELDAINKKEDEAKEKKRNELGKELSNFQDQGLNHVRDVLMKLAAALDAEAGEKIKTRREELMAASKEVLTDEQQNLRGELSDLKIEAAKDAEKNVASRFGARETLPIVREAELNQKLAALRMQIEAELAKEEAKILSQSKRYALITSEIKKGDRTIVERVISDLRAEQVSVASAMQNDISAEALARGKEEGYNLILISPAVNVSAHNLTGELAKEFTAVSSQNFEEVVHHS